MGGQTIQPLNALLINLHLSLYTLFRTIKMLIDKPREELHRHKLQRGSLHFQRKALLTELFNVVT